jgi:membrane associated rhomboid family serine protease
VIPLRDVIPSRTTPFITVTIIALNALAWLFELSLAPDSLNEFLTIFGVVPAAFAWPTLFTSMFLHGGWSHFIGNMLYLWIFGDNVEDRFGHLKFLIFYLLTGIAATFAQYYVMPGSNVPNVGASGAIAGILGAYILMFPQARVNVLVGNQMVAMPALIVLGLWIALQLFSGVGSIAYTDETTQDVGGVAYMAHVGGFVAGLLLTFLFRGSGGNPRLSA